MAGRAVAGIYADVVKRRIGKVCGVMTIGAILIDRIGRYVINELAHTDDIVVTRITAINDAGMIIGARAKAPWGVTNFAILGRRHVGVERGGQWLTACCNTMAGIAPSCQNCGVGVVDAKSREKTPGSMARSTIGSGYRMAGHCRRFSGRVDTIAIVMA